MRQPARAPQSSSSTAVLAACLALCALAVTWLRPGEAEFAPAQMAARAVIDPDMFLASWAPQAGPPVVPSTREDAIASELLLRSHLISAGQAAQAAQVLCETARQEGFDPLLFLAVISVESAFDPLARSAVGAQGLMQLMPSTASALARGDRLAWAPGASFDPSTNVRLGVRYIADLQRRFGHHIDQALTAYNRGPGATHQILAAHGQLPASIRDFYAAPVLSRYRAFKRRYGRLSWRSSL